MEGRNVGKKVRGERRKGSGRGGVTGRELAAERRGRMGGVAGWD